MISWRVTFCDTYQSKDGDANYGLGLVHRGYVGIIRQTGGIWYVGRRQHHCRHCRLRQLPAALNERGGGRKGVGVVVGEVS